MNSSSLLTLATMQVMIAMSPGPAGVLAIKTAAAEGKRAGLALAFGLALAIVLWAFAALAGLSILFEIAPALQTILRIAGAIFLIWIGITMWLAASEPTPDAAAPGISSLPRLLRIGLMTNLANPKALAYFAAVFTGIIPPDPSLALSATLLGLIFAIEFAWYTILALIFSRPAPRRFYGRAKSWLDRVFGGIVAALGIRIALP